LRSTSLCSLGRWRYILKFSAITSASCKKILRIASLSRYCNNFLRYL